MRAASVALLLLITANAAAAQAPPARWNPAAPENRRVTFVTVN